MFRLSSQIEIGTLSFTTVVNITIISGWDIFTDTAIMKFPTNLRDENIELLSEIAKGDEVNINIGYYPDLNLHFTGFVSSVSQPQNPMIIKCEDLMWKLKQENTVNFSQKGITLDELLTEVTTYDYDAVDANLGAIRINQATTTDILNRLKKTYGLRSFIRDGILVVGFPYVAEGETHKIFMNGENGTVINSNNLKYQNADDVVTIVKGTSYQDDNSKIERWGYYEDEEIKISETEKKGAIRTLQFYNISASDLEENIRNRMPDFNFSGYSGDFLTFLQPKVVHGDKIEIANPKFPEQDGTYLVKKVTTTFGEGIGGRQRIELDIKVS